MIHPSGKEYTLSVKPKTLAEFSDKEKAEKVLNLYRIADPSWHFYLSRTPTDDWQKQRDVFIDRAIEIAARFRKKLSRTRLRQKTMVELEELCEKLLKHRYRKFLIYPEKETRNESNQST